jgi:L-alanine-DL-glutamate epimerase-like enolase superfamily enzyme
MCGANSMRAFGLLGARGIASMVMAGIDVACWDALAIAAGLPLARLLGARLKPIPAYNSNGLGLLDAPGRGRRGPGTGRRGLSRDQDAPRPRIAGR